MFVWRACLDAAARLNTNITCPSRPTLCRLTWLRMLQCPTLTIALGHQVDTRSDQSFQKYFFDLVANTKAEEICVREPARIAR